jgi:translation initiation factor 2 alpha subunit (eIF-2alpha)
MERRFLRSFDGVTDSPVVGDHVACRVTSAEDIGFVCTLLEYEHATDAFLMLESVLRRNRRQPIHVGQMYFYKVLRVDPVKGYVDLGRPDIMTAADNEALLMKYVNGMSFL